MYDELRNQEDDDMDLGDEAGSEDWDEKEEVGINEDEGEEGEDESFSGDRDDEEI